MNRESCEGCYYLKRILQRHTACHYCIIENKLRPCPPENCVVKLVLNNEETQIKDEKYRKQCASDAINGKYSC